MSEYGYLSVPQVGSLVNFHTKEVISLAAQIEIAFGIPLKRGEDPAAEVLPWSGGINVPIVGISLFTQKSETGTYKVTSTVNVLQKGKVYVATVRNVTAGQHAFVAHDTGLFTNVPEDNLYVGVFTSTGTGIVELSIDLKA